MADFDPGNLCKNPAIPVISKKGNFTESFFMICKEESEQKPSSVNLRHNDVDGT
jgi:hypothetical protein